jgi:gliding motility-associated transport system permease protein
MRGLYAIYRKELGHYFVSPVAYVIVGLFLFLSGFFFVLYVNVANEQEPDAPTWVLRAFLNFLVLVFLFFLPMVTMGVYAEEKKRGTIELLMTSPITELQIVLGKFLASLTLFAAMLLPTAGCLLFVWMHSDPVPPFRIILCGYLGTLLFGGSLLALGSFLSSLTENQIIAAALTFAAFLLLWAIDFGAQGSTGPTAQILQYLSVINHYDDFTRGVIDTAGVTYYVSFMILFIFLTVRSVDSMRWRRA